jgi:hypothetical protein
MEDFWSVIRGGGAQRLQGVDQQVSAIVRSGTNLKLNRINVQGLNLNAVIASCDQKLFEGNLLWMDRYDRETEIKGTVSFASSNRYKLNRL